MKYFINSLILYLPVQNPKIFKLELNKYEKQHSTVVVILSQKIHDMFYKEFWYF